MSGTVFLAVAFYLVMGGFVLILGGLSAVCFRWWRDGDGTFYLNMAALSGLMAVTVVLVAVGLTLGGST